MWNRDGHELTIWWFVLVHFVTKEVFGISEPCLLWWATTWRPCLEEVGQGSQAPASKWAVCQGRQGFELPYAAQPRNERTQTTASTNQDLQTSVHGG